MDDDLALLERVFEIAHDPAVERRTWNDRLVARIALRGVHLSVRPREQVDRGEPILGEERPADGGVELDERSLDAIGPAQRMAQAPGERGRFRVLRRSDRQHHELVAADARDGVRLAHDRLEAAGDRPQDGVARLVSADVVDALEPVEVDDEQRERFPRASRARERLRDAVVQQVAVREPGERVAEGGALRCEQAGDEQRGRCAGQRRDRHRDHECGDRALGPAQVECRYPTEADQADRRRRPHQPAPRGTSITRLTHIPLCFSRPDAKERARAPQCTDRRGDGIRQPLPGWGVPVTRSGGRGSRGVAVNLAACAFALPQSWPGSRSRRAASGRSGSRWRRS